MPQHAATSPEGTRVLEARPSDPLGQWSGHEQEQEQQRCGDGKLQALRIQMLHQIGSHWSAHCLRQSIVT